MSTSAMIGIQSTLTGNNMFSIRHFIAPLTLSTALSFYPLVVLADPPNLTAGSWNISAIDQANINWGGSTLTFERQVAQGSDYQVGGYFNWTGNNGAFGRENFSGTLFANNRLTLQGSAIVPPASGIVTSSYEAQLSANGTSLINGRWGGIGAIPSDNWSAVQSVAPRSTPEPQAEMAVMVGLPFLFVAARKRRSVQAAMQK
jgi:hypothetical protein